MYSLFFSASYTSYSSSFRNDFNLLFENEKSLKKIFIVNKVFSHV